ncbi:hypothetical protein SCHPADRAFT_657001 [Schizopora paradoxa]|uniref:Uncharacterized protein n=1 Tax=Schizopora paradoxa TaxID=27342 RepID=A0A0H2R625_9AGAM|nr:hypothetical protein SCHPADRAFT_657001 [Schizopora paradoxa]
MDEEHHGKTIKSIASLPTEPGVLADPAPPSESSNEGRFASDRPELVLEPHSDTLESRDSADDASRIALCKAGESDAHDNDANSAKAVNSEEAGAEYWKTKFLRLREDYAALEGRLQDAHP